MTHLAFFMAVVAAALLWSAALTAAAVRTRRPWLQRVLITLAVVAVEVARRVGVRLVGVGLPGHFLVGDADDASWFADPFHGRSGLTASDCRQLLVAMGAQRWSDRYLEPTPNRLIVARMLNNLKATCEFHSDDVRLALVMQARHEMPEFAAEADAARHTLAIFN